MNEPLDFTGETGTFNYGDIHSYGSTPRDFRQLFRSKRKSKKTYLGRSHFWNCFSVHFVCIRCNRITVWTTSVKYGLMSGFFGLDLTLCLGIAFWVIRKRIRDAELRRLMSEDLNACR